MSEGVVAESRGARARIYRTTQVRSQFKTQRPDTIEWSPIGLPADCYPLLASQQNAFAPSGEPLMVHGGASIEEVIVPLVEIAQP